MTDWRTEVDTWWAARLRLPPAALRRGGIWVMPGSGYLGVMAVAGACRPLGYGLPGAPAPAPGHVGRARLPLAEGGRFPGGPLAAATRAAAALGNGPGAAIGPAWHGYVTETSLTRDRSPAVRPLSPADLPLLIRLREQTPPAERDESGATGLPAYGYLDRGALLAVACLGLWHEMPTLGVLTHPAHRGRGLARAVVAAAAEAGLDRRAVVQYRAWRANPASIAVARHTGFAHYCDGLVIELGDEPVR